MTVDVTLESRYDSRYDDSTDDDNPRSGLTPPPRFLSMKNDTGAQVVTSELSCTVTRNIQLLHAE